RSQVPNSSRPAFTTSPTNDRSSGGSAPNHGSVAIFATESVVIRPVARRNRWDIDVAIDAACPTNVEHAPACRMCAVTRQYQGVSVLHVSLRLCLGLRARCRFLTTY